MDLDINFCSLCGKELQLVTRQSPSKMFLFTYKECPDKNYRNSNDPHFYTIIRSEPIGPYDPYTGKLKA